MPAPSLEEIENAYRKHGHSVLRRAQHLLGSVDDAREALHEVFVDLLEHPEQFEGRSSLVTWLYSATTHRCLNRLRNARTRARLFEERNEPRDQASHAGRVESGIELRRLLATLPHDVAEAAIYHHLDELTQDEIASVMRCSRRHVGHLLERLRARMQTQIEAP
jgi:RNA polymerase sigma-70 factor (ECF subfamily)